MSNILAGEGVEDDDDSSSDDTTWTPSGNKRDTPVGPKRKPKPRTCRSLQPGTWRCFATAGVENGHQDAEELKRLGVWIGSAEKPDQVITLLSFNEVFARYHTATEGGTVNVDVTEPKTLGNRWPNQPTNLTCASCFHGREAFEEGMSTKEIRVQHKDMQRMVSYTDPDACPR